MAEAERRLLTHETHRARRGAGPAQDFEDFRLALVLQGCLEFVGAVEIILDRALIAARDEDEMLDSGRDGLIDHILDGRPVKDGQHFLGDGFGGWQDTGSQAGNGQDGFANSFHDS